jgi:hypothetical protein
VRAWFLFEIGASFSGGILEIFAIFDAIRGTVQSDLAESPSTRTAAPVPTSC